nr:lysyl oxidase family protein [Bacteroidota bacterium]
MIRIYILAITCLILSRPGFTQCPAGEGSMVVSIVPDDWPNEISWDIRIDGDVIASGNVDGGEICVPLNTCVIFTIHDSYGDGIFDPGGYWVTLDDDTVASGGTYQFIQITEINCPPGYSCGNPLTIAEGQHLAQNPNSWYIFTPTLSGSYEVTTCDLASCDTRLWIYDHCNGLVWDDSPAGSMYFSESGCGDQAMLSANLQVGVQIYIRIGGEGSCDDQSIAWALNYLGPISGCTEINSCNFDPLATVDDGSCIPFGDPTCPEAPDLIVDQGALTTSLSLDTIDVTQSNCYISEGCLNGFGPRELIKFTTRIDNIGQQDYYIGNPAQNPDQFETQNCHGHTHYKGYAEYLLFDEQGQQLAIGFKNGFCVMDIDCNGEATAQYGCGDMGITAGCADIYGNGTPCNWLDITTVPEGLYTLVVRTNWDNSPDALGRVETDLYNNWAQVCLFIDRSPGLSISVQDDCEPYFD